MTEPPPAHPTRLAFLGTPELAAPFLVALVEAGHEIALVITGEDRRRGRREEPSPSPVKAAANDLGLPVAHDMGTLVDCGADLGVVVAFGALIPTRILDVLPMVNVHFSSLPRWRGPAPVEWAVRSGDTTTGVCVIAVGEDFDIGGIHARTEVQIGPRETAVGLRNRLVDAGVELLVSTLAAGLEAPVPQVGEPTWAEKLTVSDRELDWGLTAVALDRLVRAGGAWTLVHGRRLKVLAAEPSADGPDGPPGLLVDDRVATGDGWLRLVEVQTQDRSRQPFATWWVGARIEPGVHLGR